MRFKLFGTLLSFLIVGACFGNSIQVSVQFVGQGGATWHNSYYTYPYYFEVRADGPGGTTSILALCDDARDNIVLYEQWTASVTQLTQSSVDQFRFKQSDGLLNGLSPLQAYYYAGYIMTQLTAYSWDVKNAAIWRLFSPGQMASDPAIEQVYASAGVGGQVPEVWSFPVTVYTPTSQGFIIENGVTTIVGPGQELMSLVATPEPATLTLLSGALLALAWAGRKSR